ncbi:MAG: hypothetical protein SVU32_04650 [Candidatus Nanohaloarchaea archaeon]|nr:hypothetical protein [Candidatus Nanohaloarchaea archaeon]
MTLEDDLDEHDIAEELDHEYTKELDQEQARFWRAEFEGLENSYGVAAKDEKNAAAVIKAALNLHLDAEAYTASAIDELDDEYDSIEDELEPFYDPRNIDSPEHTTTEPVYVRVEPR